LAGEPLEDLERLTQRRFAVLVAFHERLGVQGSAERASLTHFRASSTSSAAQRRLQLALLTKAGEAAGSARAPREERAFRPR
jgi:hypothetical protein